MPNRRTFAVLVVLGLLLAVSGGGLAQTPQGDGQSPIYDVGTSTLQLDKLEGEPLAVDANLGAGFYYQGVLTENRIPVNGERQMEFRLWDMAIGGTQVGATLTPIVAVNRGQFNVELAWGSSHIDGRALWLGVRALDTGGVWRDLGRSKILAVPYAMSLMPDARINAKGVPGITVESNFKNAIHGITYSTSKEDAAVYGLANAISGSAKGGYFVSGSGIGVYGLSYTTEGVFGEAPNHDGVTGRSVVSGRSGVYGYSVNGYGVTGASDETHGVWGRTQSDVGAGLFGSNSTNGVGVAGFQTGYSGTDRGEEYFRPGGLFGGRNGVIGISKEPVGIGVLGWHKSMTGIGTGIHGQTDSPSGWAGWFSTSSGNGVRVSTPAGKTGLSVTGGTKNGVVATNDGSRLLYSEEATEVWFADYGFGRLTEGMATITIDPVFAQTVNLFEPYHVFLQVYGDADIYVTNRTVSGFDVRLREGDPSVEFSYRMVAKRLGFEGQRLERAPWADDDPNLYPEKARSLETLQQDEPVDTAGQ